VTLKVPKTLKADKSGFILSGYIIATPLNHTATSTLTLPYLGHSKRFQSIPVLKPDIPGGIKVSLSDESGVPDTMILVDGKGNYVPPYDERLAGIPQPIFWRYINNNQARMMPIFYLNIQHQFTKASWALMQFDPKTMNTTNIFPLNDSVAGTGRLPGPVPLQLPTYYIDAATKFQLPIPDGYYVVLFTFFRLGAAADGKVGPVKEYWTSPPFQLTLPDVTPLPATNSSNVDV
jgi:hypothetical protein